MATPEELVYDIDEEADPGAWTPMVRGEVEIEAEESIAPKNEACAFSACPEKRDTQLSGVPWVRIYIWWKLDEFHSNFDYHLPCWEARKLSVLTEKMKNYRIAGTKGSVE